MRAGRLRHSIVIQEVIESRSDSGEVVETWVPFATVFAAKDMPRGKEAFIADQITDTTKTLFRIRYLAGVKPKMRIVHDCDTWDIKAVTYDNRQTYSEIYCEMTQ